jgi:hypothetical protein
VPVQLEDHFKINLNLNQNLWGMLITYAALGAAEYYHLCCLFWISLVVACGLSLSVLISFAFYTYRYCKKKLT